MWLSRFGADVDAPARGDTTKLTPTIAAWSAERFQVDGRTTIWAKGLHNIDLAGDLSWYSGGHDKTLTRPLALCVAHFFNHQTHHRGQVHAMLTAAGQVAPVSDLVFMDDNGA